ncbi:MAG: GDP-mannose 4,6-dehydratase, partial [Salinimicrobium sediminis]|nr:GDP-mannose 4,6-dehydratase [Salinimicrobium sediminis]
MKDKKYTLVTGGAGFIGSNYINLFVKEDDTHIVNLDLLTYAGDLDNLNVEGHENYTFVHGDIRDKELVNELFEKYRFSRVINFAAESHVDNS